MDTRETSEVQTALGGPESWDPDELDDLIAEYEREDRSSYREPRKPDIKLRPAQGQVFNDSTRFRVLVAGRRFGKSYLAVPELIRMAQGLWRDGSDREAWYVSPTYKQARRDLWRPLKRLAKPFIAKVNETTMSVDLVGGGRISLHGAEAYDSLRGAGLNGLVLDEYGDIAPEAWTEALRPMLSDRQGSVLFIGTPEGFNHFYELYTSAHSGERPDWKAWHYTTIEGGNVPASEIESARLDLDPKVFRQEYEASFESLYRGSAYHAFNRNEHLKHIEFNLSLPVCWSLDFNVGRMCSVIAQASNGPIERLSVFDEIVMPNASTLEVCQEFSRKIREYTRGRFINLKVYGDATEGRSTMTGGAVTDWTIIKNFFRNESGFNTSYHVPSKNGPVRDRVNSVNAMLKNANGDIRMYVDPKCVSLRNDLEQVGWEMVHNVPTGKLDQKSNPSLTHMSDALGYLVVNHSKPLQQKGGASSTLIV